MRVNALEERRGRDSNLERPVTFNGFRDRLEIVDLQAVYFEFASEIFSMYVIAAP